MLSVSQALQQRRSIRSFQSTPIARQQLEAILTMARQAPSGGNLQPGSCHVLTGKALASLKQALLAAAVADDFQVTYQYYPEPLRAPFKGRVMGAAQAMYEAANIDRLDKPARAAQQLRNVQFHGAPVAIVVTIDQRLALGSWVDLGGFIQSLLLAAKAQAIDSCAIGAIAPLHHVIARHLCLPEHELTFCGVALGYADQHSINQTNTERLPLAEFCQFYDD